jgi:hypothetical protein
MDMKTWRRRDGHGDMDMEAWTNIHGIKISNGKQKTGASGDFP